MNILEYCWYFIQSHFEWFIAIEGSILTTAVLQSAGPGPALLVFFVHLLMVMLFFSFAGEGEDAAGDMTRNRNLGTLTPVAANSPLKSTTMRNSPRSSGTWF